MNTVEIPGVEVTIEANFQPKLYIIAPSDSEAERIREITDSDSVNVTGPPNKKIYVSRRPADCEMIIDLRDHSHGHDEFISASWSSE